MAGVTVPLIERQVRCPCCKREFVVHVDGLRYVFVEANPTEWPAAGFRQAGKKRAKTGTEILSSKEWNPIPRHPDKDDEE